MVRSTAKTDKNARLEARISVAQKALIERAAAYEGRTVTDFVIHTVQEAAKAVIRGHEIIELDAAESRAFVDGLLKPQRPNKALKAAVKEYRTRVNSQ